MKTIHDAASASASPSPSSPFPSMEEKSSKSVLGRLRRKVSSRKTDKRALSLTDSETSKYGSELQRVFEYFDEDGDGKISPAELQTCVSTVGGNMSIDEAEAAVTSSDLNGDGQLDFEEFQKLMEASGEKEKNDTLKGAFAMYDMDEGSGCITPTSLKRMLSRLGDSKSVDDCKTMIRKFDLNGDGVLNFEEFRIMMR